jgi:hypothetical protein
MNISPAVQALLVGGDELPDRAMTCCVCGGPAVCPGFIVLSVRLWNEEEIKLATEVGRMANLIKPSEMGITCGEAGSPCMVAEAARRRAIYMAEINTTAGYLSLLRAGTYNPEGLHWLRTHGHAKDVARILAKEGTGKANAKPY